jgi:hypothetical protein
LFKLAKYFTALLLILLASTLLSSLTLSAYGQDEVIFPETPTFPLPSESQAEVILITTAGGTTNPAPGTYYYYNSTVIKLTAVPDQGYAFSNWEIQGAFTPGHSVPQLIIPPVDASALISGDVEQVIPNLPTPSAYDSLSPTQNPLYIVCGYNYTYQYQAVFVPITPTGTEQRVDAVVVLKDSVGGAVDPVPGTYTFADGESFTMTATPDEGQEFLYWIATGSGVAGHESQLILENPLNIQCGFGYTYDYQAVFAPSGTAPSAGISTEYFYAIIIILVIIAVIGIGAALMYRGKSKTK